MSASTKECTRLKDIFFITSVMLNSVIHCVQEMEMQRRLALEKRLAEEEKKDSLKKKKKIHF